MTQKGNNGQVGYVLCAEKTESELFDQFRPQGFLKMVDDRTGNMRDICFEVLSQSMTDFCVVID